MRPWKPSRTYRSAQGAVAYDRFGEGPPLVLVHGTPSSSYLWRNIAPVLARRWTVYVYDLLGYGASEKREGQDVSLAAQTRLLAELLDHWGLDRPNIVGHDFGGAITLRTHLLEGRDFNRIALVDAVAVAPWGSPFVRHVKQHVEAFEGMPEYIHRQIVATYIRGAIHKPMDDEAIAPFVEPWLGPTGQSAFYRQIAQMDQRYTDEVEPLYGTIERPVLILWGEQDEWIPVAQGKRLHEAIPGSEFQLIPNAGHFAQEDAPEFLAERLVEFFSREPTGDG